MPRKWSRLVALVSLVAFLAANTHAGAVLTRLTTAPSAPEHDDSAAESGPSTCCHCHDETPEATTAQTADDRCPSGPECPHCPKGPTCPCPGGCATCNVAKVPCCVPPPNFSVAEVFLGDSPEALPSFYSPPAAGSLIRPPRV